MIKMGAGKNYQWILSLGGNFDEEHGICIILKYLPTECLLVVEGTKTVIIGQHLDKVNKININYVVPDIIPPGHNSTYIVSQPRIHNFNLLIVRK